MSVFTPAEIAYLNSQRLGRLALVDATGQPYVVPVGFRYNPDLDSIDIAGRDLGRSKKFAHIAHDGRIAFVVDDVLPPWEPRGIQVRGRGLALSDPARPFLAPWGDQVAELIRVQPAHVSAWGLDTDAYAPNRRSVVTSPAAGDLPAG